MSASDSETPFHTLKSFLDFNFCNEISFMRLYLIILSIKEDSIDFHYLNSCVFFSPINLSLLVSCLHVSYVFCRLRNYTDKFCYLNGGS